ncbi:MORN motif-containing protein [Artemisia annua]|uniref:MORN motif-containing protein n=1 Tax=Artemisia annua TaxID=35608 RepID=A0A2U1LEM9_ARTAN|nr:MORN motif-containing protein [Artemisia annua]
MIDATEDIDAEYPQATFYYKILTYFRQMKGIKNFRTGPGEDVANETTNTGDTLMIDLQTYKLRAGVKPSVDQKDGWTTMHSPEGNSEPQMNNEAQFSLSLSFDESTDASLQAQVDFESSASSR